MEATGLSDQAVIEVTRSGLEISQKLWDAHLRKGMVYALAQLQYPAYGAGGLLAYFNELR